MKRLQKPVAPAKIEPKPAPVASNPALADDGGSGDSQSGSDSDSDLDEDAEAKMLVRPLFAGPWVGSG